MGGIEKILEQACRSAGKTVLATVPSDGVVQKEGRGNPVTAADLASDELIIQTIKAAFPSHQNSG